MGEQCDGEFLTAACSNSAQKCLKTVWYFSEMFRRKNPVWKMSSSTNCYIIIYWPFTEYPWHTSVRQGTQYAQLGNTEHENKNHQANLLAWLKWEAFLALKKIHPTSYCSKYCFLTDFRKEFAHLEQLVRASCPCRNSQRPSLWICWVQINQRQLEDGAVARCLRNTQPEPHW